MGIILYIYGCYLKVCISRYTKAPKGYHQVFAQVLRKVLKLNGVGLVLCKPQMLWAAHSKDRGLKMSLRLREEWNRKKVPFRTPESPCWLGFLRKWERALCSSVL